MFYVSTFLVKICYDLTSCSITGDKYSTIITFELLPRTSRKWSGYGKMQKNCEVNKDKISKNAMWQTDAWIFLTNKFTTLNNVSTTLRFIHFSSFSSPNKNCMLNVSNGKTKQYVEYVQNYNQRHLNKVNFTLYSSISIVDFEKVNVFSETDSLVLVQSCSFC